MNKKIFQIQCLAFILLLLLCSISLAANKIRENDLITILKEIDQSTIEMNVLGIMKHLSPNIIIITTIETANSNLILSFNYKSYQKILVKTWNEITNYKYEKSNQRINIADQGLKATVSTNLIESYTMDSHNKIVHSNEIATFRLIDGIPLITKIEVIQSESPSR